MEPFRRAVLYSLVVQPHGYRAVLALVAHVVASVRISTPECACVIDYSLVVSKGSESNDL